MNKKPNVTVQYSPENGEGIAFINTITQEEEQVESPKHKRKELCTCKNLH